MTFFLIYFGITLGRIAFICGIINTQKKGESSSDSPFLLSSISITYQLHP